MGTSEGALNPSLRASDADRERIVEILRQHSVEGRLTSDEFEERMAAAYDAKTMGALAELTVDLPVDLAEHARQRAELAARNKPRKPLRKKAREEASGLVSLGVVLTVVWFVSGAGYYWPAWPLGILAAITLARGIDAWGKR